MPNNPTTICLHHPTLKRKDIFKDKRNLHFFLFPSPRLLLRSLAPSLARSLPRSQNHHHHRILLLLDHFICKLVSVERIILVEVLEPPFLFFFFFFDFFGCAGKSLKVWCQERLDRV
jgi:hypothetical protein